MKKQYIVKIIGEEAKVEAENEKEAREIVAENCLDWLEFEVYQK